MCPSAKLTKTSVLPAACGPSERPGALRKRAGRCALSEVGELWPGLVGLERWGWEGSANLQDPRQGALGELRYPAGPGTRQTPLSDPSTPSRGTFH